MDERKRSDRCYDQGSMKIYCHPKLKAIVQIASTKSKMTLNEFVLSAVIEKLEKNLQPAEKILKNS